MNAKAQTLAIIGLGYVGLPLVVEFGKITNTIGFDISETKVAACRSGRDPSRELSDAEMAKAKYARYTTNAADLIEADFIIVAVPTPVDEANIPDLKPLIAASISVGQNLKTGATIVFESTVYPGATEEVCVPIIERESGLKWKQDFFVGYSPERINPGDKEHSLTKILKIVSGDTTETLERIANLYERVIEPGVHRAGSIKTAEAAKVIENTQRDLNIALMNELAIIFAKMEIDTREVLVAAGTKWNFLDFKPGLVGGHCIGVDPYYLTYKAVMLGYHPQVILAGRRINDSMGKFIAEQTIKKMIAGGNVIKGAKVNVLGLTFKENCGDLRNSKVVDIIRELRSFGAEVYVTDPLASQGEAQLEYGIQLRSLGDLTQAEAVVVAVAHLEYKSLTKEGISQLLNKGGVLIDVKSIFDPQPLRNAGYHVWQL
jgi:UDP-N-acetyl-D-galactosamine dehydrogenase